VFGFNEITHIHPIIIIIIISVEQGEAWFSSHSMPRDLIYRNERKRFSAQAN
jgi:hypothetical protein